MKSTVRFEKGIVHFGLIEFTDEKEASEIIAEFEKIFADWPGKVSVAVYLDKYRSSTSKVRSIAAQFLKSKADRIEKVALVGNSNKPFELTAKIVMSLSGFKEFRFLKTEKEAVNWIRGKN